MKGKNWPLIVVIVVAVGLVDSLPSPLKERLPLLLYVVGIAWVLWVLGSILWGRLSAGAVLVDLPHPWHGMRTWQLVFAACCVAFAAYLFLSLPEDLDGRLSRLALAGLCVGFAVLMVVVALSPLRMTERGFVSPSGFIAWKDVASSRWSDVGIPMLTLVPRRWLPYYVSPALPWPVPPDKKEAVSALLARFSIPEAPSA